MVPIQLLLILLFRPQSWREKRLWAMDILHRRKLVLVLVLELLVLVMVMDMGCGGGTLLLLKPFKTTEVLELFLFKSGLVGSLTLELILFELVPVGWDAGFVIF